MPSAAILAMVPTPLEKEPPAGAGGVGATVACAFGKLWGVVDTMADSRNAWPLPELEEVLAAPASQRTARRAQRLVGASRAPQLAPAFC
jgi:hypothetical protein